MDYDCTAVAITQQQQICAFEKQMNVAAGYSLTAMSRKHQGRS